MITITLSVFECVVPALGLSSPLLFCPPTLYGVNRLEVFYALGNITGFLPVGAIGSYFLFGNQSTQLTQQFLQPSFLFRIIPDLCFFELLRDLRDSLWQWQFPGFGTIRYPLCLAQRSCFYLHVIDRKRLGDCFLVFFA